MKNYLYILCAFLLAFAGCTKDADVEPIAPAPDGNTQVVLTGFSGRGTRTGFGGAEDGAVPFLWSAGDYIWARNTRSEAIAEGGSQATFVFESLETADTYDVFYNLTGPAAATALIPAEQTQQAAGELNLGQNGDFGYATAQNGTFTLEHATSYVWFDTYSSDVTSNLLSITLSVSGGQTIAGEAAFADGKLGDCKGSSSVTLSFGEEGVALPSQSNDTDVFAAMVLYPADLSTATVSIVYKFADGSVYLQTKSGKTLTPGHTLRLSTQIAKSDCKSSGAFFMTEAGVAEELPTEPIGYLKVVTLGESTLSAEELTSIAGNLANGAVIDLGEATFATTEFPMDFTRKTNLQEIALPRNIQTFTPSTYNSGAFYGCKNLTRITFPEGLTAIGQNCFRNCAKLESIELPSSVRTLDIYAFYGCKLLTSVVIPEGVEAIPRFLFDSCTALTDVTLPSTLKSIGAEAFEATEFPVSLAGNAKLGTIKFFENTTSIAAGAFKGCTALTKATVPTGVEIIGESTFEGCTALASLTLPSSVKTVGDKAFKGCSALVETSLSAIENIGTEAFAGTGLTSAKISATTLGEKSFRDCTELTAITLGSATTIPAEMFAGCTSITTVTIPKSIETIGTSAFDGCSKLATLTLGTGVTTLGDRAFADCGLTALALPDNVTTLGDGAFSNNPNIATLQFGAGLTAISDNAFATNNAIESLTIPKTIATIGAGSFANWSKLTKLTISGNTLTSIGSKAFENAALLADVYAEPTTAPAVQADSFSGAGTSVQGSKTFHVASVEAYSSWTTAASGYTMEALGPDYLSEGLYYRASGEDPWKSEIPQTFTTLYVKTAGDNTVMTTAQMKSVADAVLALAAPATVDFSEVVYESTTFPNSFKSNANLAGIVFPQNVTATASAAFQKTGMTSVTVLKDISYGSNAFDSCASLVSVTVEEGVTEIGNYMFQNTKLTSVTLPNSVTKIGASAFNGCSLTTINFGQGVKTIENSAFQNCGELTEIILPDATETLGQNAFGDCPKLAKISLGKNMKTLEAYCFVGYSKGCPLLGDIICRATTPPTLKDDYGTGPFGGGWSPVAGKDVPAENRIIHLPKSADLVGGTGAYADSSWVKLTSSTYGFAFKYDVEG